MFLYYTINNNTQLDLIGTVATAYAVTINGKTFSKTDVSDFNYTNNKTYFLAGSPGYGVDLIVIDWGPNGERTAIKVWNGMGYDSTLYQSIWIAPSGYAFLGQDHNNGYIYKSDKHIWGIDSDGSAGIPHFIIIKSPGMGTYIASIAPNSRAKKTNSGWTHTLIIGLYQGVYQGVYLYDGEIGSSEAIFSANSAGIGWNAVDEFEDKIFGNVVGIGSNYFEVFKKQRFSEAGFTYGMYNNWATVEIIDAASKPKAALFTYAGNNGLSYFSDLNVLATVGTIGCQLFHYPKLNAGVMETKNFDLTYNPSSYKYIETMLQPYGDV